MQTTLRYLNTASKLWASSSGLIGALTVLVVLSVAVAHVDCRRESSLGVAKYVLPEYPYVARVYHLTGSVSVRVEVGPDGKVVRAVGSGSSAVLTETAERNVRGWQFHIPKAVSRPAACTVYYEFKLVGKASERGLTTVELAPPNRLTVVDQPAFERVPEPVSPGGIPEPTSYEPKLLQQFQICYSKHCSNQATSSIEQVPLHDLVDCFSKYCEQDLKAGR